MRIFSVVANFDGLWTDLQLEQHRDKKLWENDSEQLRCYYSIHVISTNVSNFCHAPIQII